MEQHCPRPTMGILTFNNYTPEDISKFEEGFKNGKKQVVSAIIGKEVGESVL